MRSILSQMSSVFPYENWVYADLWGKNWQALGFLQPLPISGHKGLGTPRCGST